MKRILLIIVAITVAFSLYGCGSKDETSFSKDIFAMDTSMTITAYGENAEKAVDEAVAEIQRLDALWSVGNENSEISLLNSGKLIIPSDETVEVLKQAVELYEQTGGAFDITIKPLVDLWGFSSGEYKVPDKKEIDKLLGDINSENINYSETEGTLVLEESYKIDFGGIAKGYTSARIMEIFREKGCTSAMVSLGGNVQVLGAKPDGSKWRVAVINPDNSVPALSEADYIGVLNAEDKAVITSGGYERYFEENGKRYHHILDPKTGYPAESNLISVSIVSDDGCLADGLSTALFVMGKEKATEYWQKNREKFDAIFVDKTGMIYITEGIEDQFESKLDYEIIK